MKALIYAFFLLLVWLAGIALIAGAFAAGWYGHKDLAGGCAFGAVGYGLFVLMPCTCALLQAIQKS